MLEKREKELTFIDLFSGIGGFRLGMEKQGFKCVWSCDIDKYANQVYRYKFGGENHEEGDIRKVDAGRIPEHDILCAGFPCQSFSIAGKKRGFDDPRGTLFFEICRIARVKKPRLLFLENVKGLLSNERGKTFATILNSLQELGYSIEWQVLDSQNFGVPQHRERVFIIGHLGGFSGQQIFPIGKNNRNDKKTQTKTAKKEQKIVGTIIATYYKRGYHNPYVLKSIINNGQSYRIYDSQGIALTITTQAGCYHVPKIVSKNDREHPRMLTPLECERLQGFPDDWTKWGINEKGEKVGISDTQRYRMIGNAVTVNVIEVIAENIRRVYE